MPNATGDVIPELRPGLVPPRVLGTAALTTLAFAGRPMAALEAMIAAGCAAGRSYDRAVLAQLAFRKTDGLARQAEVLAGCQVFRVAGAPAGRPGVRMLAVMAPGDLMVNAPLDFLTEHLDVQLDLLYLLPGVALPDRLPDHDLAFFAVSDADAALRGRLGRLFDRWPRPVLNDPRHLPSFERDALSRALAGIPGISCPATRRVTRAALAKHLAPPTLIRPVGSHAGTGLARLDRGDDLTAYLAACDAAGPPAAEFFLSDFVDYRSPDGLFRKYRVAFIDRRPFLCHMAVSENWMIHYLNAGMTDSAAKRQDEADAMAEFDRGFARRHAGAFDALHARFALDYYSIDCAQTPDGRLLVFEADTGAIIHLMDPPDLFPYKRPQMLRIFAAFGDMLTRTCRAAATA